MSYKSLINSNLVKAFNLVKDLAEDVVFVRNNVTGFDFGTGQVESTASQNLIVKTIVIDSEKKSKEHNANKKHVMFKTKDLGDVTAYDHLLINGVIWKLGPVVKNSGFIILAEIYKEV